MSKFDDMFLESIPTKCNDCGGRMIFKGGGSYECMECGAKALDAFGKVKSFLEECGGAQPMPIIAEATGVPITMLNRMLKEGRLQIPPGSKVYLRCERCGCAIRSGRFCSQCEVEVFKGIQNLMEDDKRTKQNIKGTSVAKKIQGRMRFADKDHI